MEDLNVLLCFEGKKPANNKMYMVDLVVYKGFSGQIEDLKNTIMLISYFQLALTCHEYWITVCDGRS